MEEPQTETVVERTEAQLVELVKNQVEYYFSKENLQSDPFLSSQMDAQMCVPISVVMKVGFHDFVSDGWCHSDLVRVLPSLVRQAQGTDPRRKYFAQSAR